MRKQRKPYTSEEKVVLRRHLLAKEPISHGSNTMMSI